MTARRWAWALGAMLVAGAAVTAVADDNARKKGSSGGGSSRGGSESAGARHTGGSGNSGSSRSGGEVRSESSGQRERGSSASGRESSNDSRRGSSAESRRATTGAEARHPEPGTGHGYRSGRNYGYAGSSYYYFRPSYRSYYRPYFGWYGVPYYDWYYDDPFYYGGYYGGGVYGGYNPRYRYRDSGSVRTLVEPERTKVFVDGYYAGEVDDFDGMFQRLYVGPGRHDISFKLEGFRTHRVMVYVTEDHTIKIRHDMQPGTGEETVEDLSGGRSEPPYRMSDADPARERDRDGRQYDDRRDARDGGALRLDVRPDDASIYVDGEFIGTARRAGIVNLPAGRHRIEVVRPGHRTVEREVEIQAGRTETVAIDLQRN